MRACSSAEICRYHPLCCVVYDILSESPPPQRESCLFSQRLAGIILPE